MQGVHANTYSIVGRCQHTGAVGCAVASAVPAVGAICIVTRPGIGVVTTQSWVNPYLAESTLDRLAAGEEAQSALKDALASDDAAAFRQVGAIGFDGPGAAWTGGSCTNWCGQHTAVDHAVQGNMLTGPEVLDAMSTAFAADPNAVLEDRLMAALTAGQEAGGDKRGRQSAALVVADRECYRRVDLRVDEHADPVAELARVLTVSKAQLFPFVAGMPKRGQPPAPAPDEVVATLLKSPPDRPGGGGAREPKPSEHGDGISALDPALITGLCLSADRLLEVGEAFRQIRTEIDKLREVDLDETHPAIVFHPFDTGSER